MKAQDRKLLEEARSLRIEGRRIVRAALEAAAALDEEARRMEAEAIRSGGLVAVA